MSSAREKVFSTFEHVFSSSLNFEHKIVDMTKWLQKLLLDRCQQNLKLVSDLTLEMFPSKIKVILIFVNTLSSSLIQVSPKKS